MAHFTYIRGSLGGWATATVVTDYEFWAFDQAQYKAVNGDDGGAWAPSSAIIIGGSGLEITGDLTTDSVYSPPRIEIHGNTGDLDVNSGGDVNVKTGGEIIWESGGSWTMQGGSTATVAGTITSSTGTLAGTWAGGPTWTGNHTFSGNPTFTGTVAISSGTLEFLGSSSIAGSVTASGFYLAGTVNLSGVVSPTGAGRITKRRVSGPDANSTYGPATADVITIGDLTANRVYTITDGTINGETLIIKKKMQAAAWVVTFYSAAGFNSFTGAPIVLCNHASGDLAAIELTWNADDSEWDITSATWVP